MSAFEKCTSLNSVSFGQNSQLNKIGDRAFYNCTSLTSIEIPASVRWIDDYAFEYCTSLASIEIPASVRSIGKWAFYGCSKLASVTFANTNGWWYSSSSAATSGTSISATDLADPAKAARYLRSTYYNYYWERS